MSQRELCLKAIELDARRPAAYVTLATSNGSVTLPGGQVLNGTQQLCRHAIALDRRCASAYLTLAERVYGDPSQAGQQRQLCLDAIAADVRCAGAYEVIARRLCFGETVKLPSGEEMNGLQLCLRAIAVDSRYSRGYHTLTTYMSPDKPVTLPDGTIATWEQVESLAQRFR
jgi:hypothetical protein